jgi:sugar phosphate isomerase/epimerase
MISHYQPWAHVQGHDESGRWLLRLARRGFGGTGQIIVLVLAPCEQEQKQMVGAQLIIWDQDVKTSLPSILDFCANTGYAFVEAARILLEMDPAYVRETFRQSRIPLLSIHVGYDDVTDSLDETLAFVHKVDAELLIASGVADADSQEGYLDTARMLNEAGRICHMEGIRFYYHNLWDGLNRNLMDPMGIEILLEALLGNRCDYFHIKDGRMTGDPATVSWCPLGQGDVRLEDCVKLLATRSRCHYVVEQDVPVRDAFEEMKHNYHYLTQLIKQCQGVAGV